MYNILICNSSVEVLKWWKQGPDWWEQMWDWFQCPSAIGKSKTLLYLFCDFDKEGPINTLYWGVENLTTPSGWKWHNSRPAYSFRHTIKQMWTLLIKYMFYCGVKYKACVHVSKLTLGHMIRIYISNLENIYIYNFLQFGTNLCDSHLIHISWCIKYEGKHHNNFSQTYTVQPKIIYTPGKI